MDIDIRVQRQSNEKIEQQIISLCRSTGDERVIDALEHLSADLGSKMIVRSNASGCSSRRDDRREMKEEEKMKKGGSSAQNSVCSSLVHVSIDGVRRSNTSQSARSSASSSSSSTVSKQMSWLFGQDLDEDLFAHHFHPINCGEINACLHWFVVAAIDGEKTRIALHLLQNSADWKCKEHKEGWWSLSCMSRGWMTDLSIGKCEERIRSLASMLVHFRAEKCTIFLCAERIPSSMTSFPDLCWCRRYKTNNLAEEINRTI